MPYDQLFLQPQLITDQELCCIIIPTVFSPPSHTSQLTHSLTDPKKKTWRRIVKFLTASSKMLLLSDCEPNRNAPANVSKKFAILSFMKILSCEIILFVAKV